MNRVIFCCLLVCLAAPHPLQGETDILYDLNLDSPIIEAYEYLALPKKNSDLATFTHELMRQLHETSNVRRRGMLATLKVQLDYKFAYRATDDDASVSLFYEKLHAIERGEDPFKYDTTGLRGYYAENDGTCQPFRLTTPFGHKAGKKYPLVVSLHHHGWSDWYRPFQGYASFLDDAIVIAPHGRGSCDYLWIAEQDVLGSIKATMDEFEIDTDRIYVTGWSMGGTGAFHLPGRYPDLFAASFPKAGNADFTAWEEAWKEDRQQMDSPFLPQRMFLRWETAPVTFAENFMHTPIAIEHGELDMINPVKHSKSMAGRLKLLGYPKVLFKAGDGGHSWGSTTYERYDWLKQHKRVTHPKRIRFTTAKYRHGKAWWLAIDRFARRMELAEIDMSVGEQNRIEIAKLKNIHGFTLKTSEIPLNADLAVKVVIGSETPAEFEFARPLPEQLSFHWNGEAWSADKLPLKATWPPAKRAGLEGPIEDAVMDAFLVVIGTTGDEWTNKIVRGEVERWLRQWRRRYQAVPRVKYDSEVTEQDVASFNLILFGGPTHNSIVKRVHSRLPVHFAKDRIIVGEQEFSGSGAGLKVIYPNPENPKRTIVIFGSLDWKGMWQLSHRFGTWFDWMPLDNRQWFDYCVFDDKTRGFETFLEVGFFDEDWSLTHAVTYTGLKDWRSRSPARQYPKFRKPPELPSMKLTDLWPVQMDTARDPFRINRSLKGLPLSIGHIPQAWGLGQWVESAITYDLDSMYRRFEVKVGIDAEGQEKISEARRDVEFTKFIVLGDGEELGYRSSVQFGDDPHQIEIDVSRVRKLTLMVQRTFPQGWLYGNICWGEPLLTR